MLTIRALAPRAAALAGSRQFSTAASRAVVSASLRLQHGLPPSAEAVAQQREASALTARQMATAAGSTYYVQDTGCDERECYKENDSPSAILDKFQSAHATNRASAAALWKSAVRLVRSSNSVQRSDSYCYSAQSSKDFMEPAIQYRKEAGASPKDSACPCVTGVTCICQH